MATELSKTTVLSVTTSWTFVREFSPAWSQGRSSPRIAIDLGNDVNERLSIRDFSRCFHGSPSAGRSGSFDQSEQPRSVRIAFLGCGGHVLLNPA